MKTEGMAEVSVGRWLAVELDRVAAWILVGTGFVCIGVARAQLAAARFTIDQITYFTSGAGAGLLLLVYGLALLISADMQDEAYKLQRLRYAFREPGLSDGSISFGLRHPLRNITVATAFAGSVALVAVGWWRASSGGSIDEALEGPLLTTAGLLLSGSAVGVSIRRQRSQLIRWLRSLLEPLEARSVATAVPRPTDPEDEWTAPGLARFHRRSCPALAFVDATPLPLSSDDTLLLEPCLLCHTHGSSGDE